MRMRLRVTEFEFIVVYLLSGLLDITLTLTLVLSLYFVASFLYSSSLLTLHSPLPSLPPPPSSFSGDKTRMDQLSKSDDCYVRASPTRGVLGGIAEHTADVITLCEAGVCVRGGGEGRRESVCV